MCRLFGFKSVIPSQVHNSLLSAENALVEQSRRHPDGWGVAYYNGGTPHLIKAAKSAVECNIFKRVSGVVSSHTVVAHLRKATLGEHSLLNTHPFQYGKWVFAHNGHIHEFDKYKEVILAQIKPQFKRYILGDTDSEHIFYFILSYISNFTNVLEDVYLKEIAPYIKEAIQELVKIIGEFSEVDSEDLNRNYLSFILCNGDLILAHQGGKKLFYSTYKTKCADRDTCPSFSDVCESVSKTGYVNHMIFSSEPLNGDNIWIEMNASDLVGVDRSMSLYLSNSK